MKREKNEKQGVATYALKNNQTISVLIPGLLYRLLALVGQDHNRKIRGKRQAVKIDDLVVYFLTAMLRVAQAEPRTLQLLETQPALPADCPVLSFPSTREVKSYLDWLAGALKRDPAVLASQLVRLGIDFQWELFGSGFLGPTEEFVRRTKFEILVRYSKVC